MKVLIDYDFNKNQLINAVIHKKAGAPLNPTAGQMYFDTLTTKLYYYNGTDWIESDGLGATMSGADIVNAINSSSSKIDVDNLDASVGAAITDSHTHSNKVTLDAITAAFTTAMATKLSGIATGAEVNVNADWNATTGDAQILNKPSIPAAQIQSDWNQSSNVALDYIKNKPSIPSEYVLPTASDVVLGGIKVGANLTMDNGVLNADNQGGSYTLPTASDTVLGGVKVGANLTITDGVLNADNQGGAYTLPTATDTILGGIKVGSRLSITNGVLSADAQSTDISGKEDKSNKVTSISASSTDIQYPSAKLVYDQLAGKQASGTYSTDIHANITALNAVSGVNTGDQDLSGYLTTVNASSTYELLLPTTPTDPAIKYLNGNKQWSEISIGGSGYAANLYFTTIDSDVSGYKKLSYMAESTETILTIAVNNQELLARSYLFDSPIGVTTIEAGLWLASYYAKVSSTAGTTRLNIEAFVRHLNNTETTLFKAYGIDINSTDYTLVRTDSVQPTFTIVTTDRLGFRVYAETDTHASITISTKVGDGNASYVNTPLALRHNQLRDINGDTNYQHLASTDVSRLANTSGTNTGDQDLSGKVDKVTGKELSSNDYTDAEQTKLSGIESGAQVNVHADWDAVTGDGEILNKPTIPAAQIQSDWNQANNALLDYIKNKPSIPSAQIQSDWNQSNNTLLDYIKNKPTIPTVITDHTALSNIGTNSHASIDTKLAGFANDRTILREPTGFLDPDAVVITYDPTTQTITVTGTVVAYYRGTDISTANPTFVSGWVSTPHANVTGHTYFLYYDGASFAWADNSFPGFDKVLISVVIYGATNKYALRECHGLMPWQDHKEFHEAIGTYKTAGGTFPSNQYVLSSTTEANRRPNIDETTISDEDLSSVLPALTSKVYTIYNLTGASVGAYTLSSGDIIPLLANNPYYNSFNTPNWGQTLMPSNSVATVWVYALPASASATSQAYRYLFVQPQWYTQATSASAGALNTAVNTENLRSPSELNLGSLRTESPEFVCIGKIIIDYTTNWRLRQVSVISGTKMGQTSSASGNYLSTVATDATLTGDGTGLNPLIVANPVVPQLTGFTISAGTTPKTLTVSDTASITGTNTGDQTLSSLGAEDVTNKVTSISASSTDVQYPSAKLVYDQLGSISTALDYIINGGA